MDNKIKQKLFIFLPILLIMSIILILFYSINTNIEEINYEFIYYKEDSRYDIKFRQKILKIVKYEKCEECDEEEFKEKEYHYSEENIKKLDEFILNNLNIKNNKEIYENELDYYEKKVLDSILLGEKFFEINVEKYQYKLDYRKNKNIGYVFYFKDNKKIIGKKLKINDDYNIVDIHTYEINFSEKNTDLIYEYMEELSKEEESKSIYKTSIYKDEEAIINSLINNDELYMLNSSNIKLLYEFSYEGLNCMTPILRLYDNNTYEYYYTYTTNEQKELIPKVGSYNYDVKNIINNIDKYERNKYGMYIIEDNLNNEYITYSSNKELKEFLESINVKLSTCLEEQN